jgi:hypothetical protein
MIYVVFAFGATRAPSGGDQAGESGTGNASLARAPPLSVAAFPRAMEVAMVDDRASTQDSGDADRERVAQDMAGRLFARGVDVHDDDTLDDVASIEEAVERFEELVQARGGDLMVDEPPRGQHGRPDHAGFRLPLRAADESAAHYVERLARAADELRS